MAAPPAAGFRAAARALRAGGLDVVTAQDGRVLLFTRALLGGDTILRVDPAVLAAPPAAQNALAQDHARAVAAGLAALAGAQTAASRAAGTALGLLGAAGGGGGASAGGLSDALRGALAAARDAVSPAGAGPAPPAPGAGGGAGVGTSAVDRPLTGQGAPDRGLFDPAAFDLGAALDLLAQAAAGPALDVAAPALAAALGAAALAAGRRRLVRLALRRVARRAGLAV